MERDRGDVLGSIPRDGGREVRVLWQVFADRTIGPVAALRLWTFTDGGPVPVAGAGLTFRAHELPALVAALNTALLRARRWANRVDAAEDGSHRDADRDDGQEGTSR
jgi:hypothetical protein